MIHNITTHATSIANDLEVHGERAPHQMRQPTHGIKDRVERSLGHLSMHKVRPDCRRGAELQKNFPYRKHALSARNQYRRLMDSSLGEVMHL